MLAKMHLIIQANLFTTWEIQRKILASSHVNSIGKCEQKEILAGDFRGEKNRVRWKASLESYYLFWLFNDDKMMNV